MVVQGDFDIMLVEPSDRKEPFKEHVHNGNTYVEVEPDAQYYIAMRRISDGLWRDTHPTLLLMVEVDGKSTGWNLYFVSNNWHYSGLYERDERTGEHRYRCLKFAIPQISYSRAPEGEDATSQGRGALEQMMGTVVVKVYSCIDAGPRISECTASSYHLTVDEVRGSSQEALAKEKYVRSSVGDKSRAATIAPRTYHADRLLDTITLSYATVPGLIKAGVIARPGAAATVVPNDKENGGKNIRGRIVFVPGGGSQFVDLTLDEE